MNPAQKTLAQIAAIPNLIPEADARKMTNAEYITAYLKAANA